MVCAKKKRMSLIQESIDDSSKKTKRQIDFYRFKITEKLKDEDMAKKAAILIIQLMKGK